MTLEEKDKYIADHLMKLTDETLRFMVADLHAEVERLTTLLSGGEELVCGDCDGSGWKQNRVEGRHACTCMTEAEPFQILLKSLEKLACLGNGNHFGNSDGNCIAIAALRSVLPLDYADGVGEGGEPYDPDMEREY